MPALYVDLLLLLFLPLALNTCSGKDMDAFHICAFKSKNIPEHSLTPKNTLKDM